MASRSFAQTASEIAAIGRRVYARGWALGTSGNFSAVVSRRPLRLAITASSIAKGALSASHILLCDENGRVVGRRAGKPSAETLLHVEIAKRRAAGAVLHTHSVWSTMLSDGWDGQDAVVIEGYEMLKGLSGVTTHVHREWVPIVENVQDWEDAAPRLEGILARHPGAHGFLIHRHGLYTWGADMEEAARHLEVLEFLLEAVGRKAGREWEQAWPR